MFARTTPDDDGVDGDDSDVDGDRDDDGAGKGILCFVCRPILAYTCVSLIFRHPMLLQGPWHS